MESVRGLAQISNGSTCSPSSGCNGSCYRLRRAFAALWRYGKTHRIHPVPYKPTCHTGPFRTQFSAEVLERPRIECRSEEHTSEIQSLMRISYAVFSLKKTK